MAGRMTIGSMFSGGGGADLGAMMAGLSHLWGIESDPGIADLYRSNVGDGIICADVGSIDYSALPAPDLLWASPSCKNASTANANRGETPEDRAAGAAICRAIETLNPRWFVLENVTQYDAFDSYRRICATLDRLGYWWNASFVQAADLGVPQTRRRLILRSSRDSMIHELPAPVPRVGWYQAIEDLLPSCPETKLAHWQIIRLPDDLRTLLMSNGGEHGDLYRDVCEEAPTVTEQSGGRVKALLHMTRNTQIADPAGTGLKNVGEPAGTVCASGSQSARAIIFGDDASPDEKLSLRNAADPVFCITTSAASHPIRVAVIDGQASPDEKLTISEGADPVFTITASAGKRPLRTVIAGASFRIVKLTPRCLARFQTFPDNYILPDNNRIAYTAIGNAVPCLMAKRIIESLIGVCE